MKKKKLKVTYKSNWDNATPEQKKEFRERLDDAYDLLFRKVVEMWVKEQSGRK